MNISQLQRRSSRSQAGELGSTPGVDTVRLRRGVIDLLEGGIAIEPTTCQTRFEEAVVVVHDRTAPGYSSLAGGRLKAKPQCVQQHILSETKLADSRITAVATLG